MQLVKNSPAMKTTFSLITIYFASSQYVATQDETVAVNFTFGPVHDIKGKFLLKKCCVQAAFTGTRPGCETTFSHLTDKGLGFRFVLQLEVSFWLGAGVKYLSGDW